MNIRSQRRRPGCPFAVILWDEHGRKGRGGCSGNNLSREGARPISMGDFGDRRKDGEAPNGRERNIDRFCQADNTRQEMQPWVFQMTLMLLQAGATFTAGSERPAVADPTEIPGDEASLLKAAVNIVANLVAEKTDPKFGATVREGVFGARLSKAGCTGLQ